MSPLLTVLGRTWAEWRELRWTGLRFGEPQTAMLVLGCLLAIALMTSLVRRRGTRRHGSESVMLPAILPVMRSSRLSAARHSAFALVLAGLLFFAAALADPYTAFTARDVSSSGRRIYVVAPFTKDLVSTPSVGDADQRQRFPDQGTEILADAREAGIPVYMIRMSLDHAVGGVWSDDIRKRAVERTGARFYRAADEAAILSAVREFDRMTAGENVQQRTTRRPAFAGYTLAAVLLWLTALTMKLTVGRFQTFP